MLLILAVIPLSIFFVQATLAWPLGLEAHRDPVCSRAGVGDIASLVHTEPSNTPHLDSILEHEAYYFPYTHSLGFPSVKWALGIQLGVWPHYKKNVMSSYVNNNWHSLTDILCDCGYRSEIYVGAEPSFDNLDRWFLRWYDYTEYSSHYNQDGPLLQRVSQAFDSLSSKDPFFLQVWTISTQPPYELPPNILGGETMDKEARYNVCMRYADVQISNFIAHLQHSPEWKNTIVVLVGDHSQPERQSRMHREIAGEFGPGYTWIHMALLGGWPGLPHPRRNEETVPQIDMAPTLLELLNISTPNHFVGKLLLRPQSRKFMCFRLNNVSILHEKNRLTFEMDGNDQDYFSIDKSSRVGYGLLAGHRRIHFNQPPWPFDKERYRDMIRAYTRLLEENRIFPTSDFDRGVYKLVP